MLRKIFTEIALQTQADLHDALQTRLPYRWDFCRSYFTPDIRLMLNSTSYFIVYAAFIFLLVRYLLKELNNISGPNQLTAKNWCLALLFTLVTATQVLWPAFLAIAYFVTCSFYPLASALVVLYMNVPNFALCRFFRFYATRSVELLYTLAPFLRISVDGDHLEDVDLSDVFTYPEHRHSESSLSETALPSFFPHSSSEYETSELSERSSLVLPHVENVSSSYEYAGSHHERFPLSSTPFASQSDEARFQHIAETSFEDISQSDYNFNLSRAIEIRDSRSSGAVRKTEIKRIVSTEIKENAGLTTDMKEGDGISGMWGKETSQKDRVRKDTDVLQSERAATWTYGKRIKKGYCGRCWRGNNLPFKPGFSKLREPYVTRSGQIYGPTRRFLTQTEYIEQYGL